LPPTLASIVASAASQDRQAAGRVLRLINRSRMEHVMDTDTNINEHRGAFPVDRPVEALIRDHKLVRKLANAYLNSSSKEVKFQAASQIMQLLETHSKLEEGVFYPGVRSIDASMIGHFEQEHQKADDVLASLKTMSLSDPQADRLVRELITMTLHHIEEEENDFFPKLEQAHLDLTPLGLQMQSFEANLVHRQAQAGTPGMRK
jgi:hemerythrin superfamily protein